MEIPKNVLVTRTKDKNQEFSNKIKALGLLVLYLPLIKIKKINQDILLNEINRIDSYDWIIFTSQNSVDIFFECLNENNKFINQKTNIACIGKKTLNKIEQNGYNITLIPDKYVSESLISEFKKINISTKKILIPTSNISRNIIGESLNSFGAITNTIYIYDTIKPTNREIEENLPNNLCKIDYVTFFSPSAVRNMKDFLIENPNKTHLFENSIFVSIGEITTKEIISNFDNTVFTADEYTLDGVVSKLKELNSIT